MADEMSFPEVKDEVWICFEKGNPENIKFFFIPEIRKELNRKRVYARIISVIKSNNKVGRCFRLNAKWAKQVTRKLETHEVIKYKLLGII